MISFGRIVFVAAVLAAPSVRAAAPKVKGPAVPAAAWAKIIDTVTRTGEIKADPPFVGQSLTVTIKTGSTTAVHEIIVNRMAGADAKRRPVGVEMSVREDALILKSGTILSEEWILMIDPAGRLDTAVYKKRVDVAGSEPVVDPPVMMDVSGPKSKAKLDEMLKFWSAR
ncbi:MAG: hypothetical protein ABL955_04615 [Elusimicrobiota bacterium]